MASRVIVFCACFWLTIVPAFANDGVALLVVDNKNGPLWKARHLEFVDKYSELEALTGKHRQAWQGDHAAKYRDADSMAGYVYVLSRSGQFEHTPFVTVKGSTAFAQLVDDHVANLKASMPDGVEPILKVAGDSRSIHSPAFEYRSPPGARSPAWDVHLRYRDSVVINTAGPKSLARLKRVPLPVVSRLTRKAKGKMWYLSYRPSAVPKANRSTALAIVQRAVNVGLQQRDQEQAGEYKNRRTVTESYLNLLRSLVFDVDEATAFTEWPEADSQELFRARLRVKAIDKSRLARMFQELKSGSRSLTPANDSAVGCLRISLAIPKDLRQAVKAVGATVGVPERVLDKMMSEGVLRTSVALTATDSSIKGVAVSDVPLKSDQLAAVIERVSGNRLAGTLSSDGLPEIRYSLVDVPGGLALLGSPGDEPLPKPPTRIEQERMSDGTVAELHLDLKECMTQQWGQKLLQRLDLLYANYLFPKQDSGSLFYEPDAQALLDKFPAEGDWSLAARMRVRANTLTIDIEMGTALHAFWRMRQCIR